MSEFSMGYGIGACVTAALLSVNNDGLPPDSQLPPMGVFVFALLWPLFVVVGVICVVKAVRETL